MIKRNRIGVNGLDDLKGLLEMPELSVLDLSDNKVSDENVLPEIFEKIPKLAVLYTQNNEFVIPLSNHYSSVPRSHSSQTKKIANYRKVMIARLPNLKYLDDRPVFEEDRRYAEVKCGCKCTIK